METNMLYRKIGNKYKPVGYAFIDFPADGIWLENKKGTSETRILYFGEKMERTPNKYANAQRQRKEEMLDKFFEKCKDKKYSSLIEIVDDLLDVMLEQSKNKQYSL